MKYDPEKALITRVVETKDVRTAVRNKIVPKVFADPENRDVWDWVLDRYDQHGKCPSLKLLQANFPDFEEEDSDDDLDLLIQHVKEKRLYADLQESVKKVAQEARDDATEALRVFKMEAADLSVRYSNTDTLDLVQSADKIAKLYKRFKRKKGMLGIPWPWARVNKATLGMCRKEFYAFYGDPGTMKTWLLIFILAFAHQHHGARPILFTQEMPAESIMLRWAAYRACVEYESFRHGRLSRKEERRFFKMLETIQEDDSFVVEELDANGAAALTEIQAKAQEHGANIIGIDGLGDLPSDSEWGSWRDTCKGLKAIARRLDTRVVGTHHTNRDKRKKPKKYDATQDDDATDVALGEALFRYTDGLFHVIRTPQNKENDELGIKSKKVREGKPCTILLNARPAVDFSQKVTLNEDGEEEGWEEDDDLLGETPSTSFKWRVA